MRRDLFLSALVCAVVLGSATSAAAQAASSSAASSSAASSPAVAPAVVAVVAANASAPADVPAASSVAARARVSFAPQVATPAAVQGPPPPPVPRKIGVRGYFLVDSNSLAASETFDATMGTSKFTAKGVGGEVLDIFSGVFARLAFSSMKEVGTRVVVIDGTVVPLDIPLTVEMKPLEIAAGWRVPLRKAPRVTPYGGAGFLRLAYKETSDFADDDENSDESFTGFVAFGGVEVVVWKWVVAGAEVQYRSISDALGTGGVSQTFNETNLGGTTFRFLVGVRR
jgi:hypothetical protein